MTAKIIYAPRTKEQIALIKKMNERTGKGIVKAFNDIGKNIISTSNKLILEPPKTGRIYHDVPYTSTGKGRKSLIKKTHQASAPGQPPANLSGKLRKSMNYTRQGVQSITVGNNAEYAARLEFGKGKLKARPYIDPSIKSNQKDIENFFKSKIIIEITKAVP